MALHVRAVALLFALVSTTAFADSADLTLRLSSVTPKRPGQGSSVDVFIQNTGPDTAHDVVLTIRLDGQPLPAQPYAPCSGDRCTAGDLAPGQQKYFSVLGTLPNVEGVVSWSGELTSSTPDPNPQNNIASAAVELSRNPFVTTYLTAPDWIDPGAEFTVDLIFGYDAVAIPHDVVGSVELPAGTGIVSLPPVCSAPVPTRIDCTTGDVFTPPDRDRLTLHLRGPARFGGETLTLTTSVRMREPNFLDLPHNETLWLSRSFVVTTTADGGNGSLRSAIYAANAECRAPAFRCAIVFDIEEPSPRPWKTIRVVSPLPPLLSASLHVDGSTETGLAGVTNPDGPPIEISGGGTVDGDGFIAAGCFQTIANLAINGFGRFGILSAKSCGNSGVSFVSGNFLGVDPTGAAAVPNLRGLVTIGTQSTVVTANTISGNVRSGIFGLDGNLWIDKNRIGVAAHADTPLPNGASGMYVGPNPYASVSYNVIAFNREFGIAIDGASKWAGGVGNRIWSNGGIAIDDGLDGPSPDVLTAHGRMATPVIVSATFDPATGDTTIRGTAPAPASGNGVYVNVGLYAADAPGLFGAGDAQRALGQTPAGDFALKVHGDLRGQWVSAATVLVDYLTREDGPSRMTELSRAVQVQ